MIKVIYLGLLLILSTSAYTQTINGIAIKVSDGDTFVLVRDSNTKVRVRLHGIDAPEISQRFGVESKKYLSSLILNRIVSVSCYDTDRYGRLIGRISNDSITDINKHMIEQGLWIDENPINPYLYRKHQHKNTQK